MCVVNVHICLYVCMFVFANLPQTTVTWEEGPSPEELLPSYWPSLDMSAGHFLDQVLK